MPYRPELGWPRVSDAVRGLDVRVLNEGEQDRRVKDVIVGAQAVPGILPLLREGLLLIVPGDRDEIILSACLAAMNGTRFAGLLLTLGVEPDPRVWELCRPAGGHRAARPADASATATRPPPPCTTWTRRCRSTTPSGRAW